MRVCKNLSPQFNFTMRESFAKIKCYNINNKSIFQSVQEHYMISFYMCTNQIGLKSFIAKDCPSEYILKGRCTLY